MTVDVALSACNSFMMHDVQFPLPQMKRSRKVGVRTFFNARCDFNEHYALGEKLGTFVVLYIE